MKLILIVVAGALAIAAGARLAIPMVPVPTTGQTLAVVIVGLLAGPRLGAASAVLYLVMVLAGLPVLASGERLAGAAFLQSATAGYVVGFIPAAAVVGVIGWRRGFVLACLAAVAGHAVVLACGVPLLALKIGWGAAVTHGLLPFLLGALAKSVVGAGIVTGIRAMRRDAQVDERRPG
ncbi:biotin transporter BioY [Marinihelvus fidelis]|uniref:Biotin transporter n=1 Tax=Marinihelvus fidelis TaxID=2613842 RepID=A0A5N0TG18_9GAMM|nr:biotin transporter BioY [Marinihelvus fidelis]KAA9133551.1 biotin transporter BioY [Marinihelvus fidelis]